MKRGPRSQGWSGLPRPSSPARGYEQVPRIGDELYYALATAVAGEEPPEHLQAQGCEQIAAACRAIRQKHSGQKDGEER